MAAPVTVFRFWIEVDVNRLVGVATIAFFNSNFRALPSTFGGALFAEADIAKWEGEQAKAQGAAVSSMTKIDALTKSAWTNEQKRTDAIKEYKRQLEDIRKVAPNDPRLSQAAIDKNLANINDQFKDSKATGSQVDLTGFNNAKNMEYIYSLYDPLMSTHLLEEVFRIMAVLQPKVLAKTEAPHSP